MDDKINIVKSPAPVIYTPQEVACIFKEQLKTPAKVVTIEGVYRQNPKSGNYYGYFYDSLAAQNSNFEMTLVVPAALREKMKDGTLVQVSGVVSKELRNRCSIDLQFNVTRYDVIEENVISEDEQRLMSLQAEKSAKGYRNVDGGRSSSEEKNPTFACCLQEEPSQTRTSRRDWKRQDRT